MGLNVKFNHHFATPGGNTTNNRTFHVGTPMRPAYDLHEDHVATRIYADGDELHAILAHMDGIPRVASNSSMIWTGEIANFIWLNLPKQSFPMS